MTKEELRKEAKDKGIGYADSIEYTIVKFSDEEGCWSQVEQAYEKGALDFAEPREKQITVLSKHIIDLQKDKGNLTDKVRELEQQIEKMKEKTVSLCEGCVRLPMLYKELDKEIKEK